MELVLRKVRVRGYVFLAIALVIAATSGWDFLHMRKPEPIISGPGVTRVIRLHHYFSPLKDTSGDTEVYFFEGGRRGGTALIMGGTHPNEPAGYMAAVILVENAKAVSGRLIVIPRANNSGFTHNDPQEGAPQRFSIKTPSGSRYFRFGSRITNPVDQWPDPDIYIHTSSGQTLSGSQTRNLNRAYPGRKDGTFTEKVAYAIAELVRKERVDLVIDLHEASPEYPVINTIVAHERAMTLASLVVMNLQLEGMNIGLEPSPPNLHGLTHRELGDYTDAFVVLMETPNPAQGRLRGRTDTRLVLSGQDRMYLWAAKLGRLFVPFGEKGYPLEVRIGRHLLGVKEFLKVYSETNPERAILVEGIPERKEILEKGVGGFLKG